MPETFKRHYLYSGTIFVSVEPCIVTTVLGSCVSVCLWDSRRRTGGINHYKASRWDGKEPRSNRFGDVAVANLVSRMLDLGCKRSNLEAKVFGGSDVLMMNSDFMKIGEDNISVAKEVLHREDISIVNSFVGDVFGRKLVFNTHDGSVLIKKVRHISGPEAKPPAAWWGT
jgi:chemotaxis protein CheD